MAAVRLYDFEVSALIMLLRIVKEVEDVLRFNGNEVLNLRNL